VARDVSSGEATGVLLVGGASTRFGSPKALARLGSESLAERAWRVLGEAFASRRVAVGKGDLELPFALVVEPAEPRAPIVGVVAGLRASPTELAVFLPVDLPLVTPELLCRLADERAVVQTGPLPGAYAKTDLPELERRIAAGDYSLRGVNARVVAAEERLLANVNTRDDLLALERDLPALDEHRA
jgi:molybdenum cofactor guanylyltransferase